MKQSNATKLKVMEGGAKEPTSEKAPKPETYWDYAWISPCPVRFGQLSAISSGDICKADLFFREGQSPEGMKHVLNPAYGI